MLKCIDWILDHLFVLLGGLLFMQAPLFMQQYQHQLIGRVDELRYQVDLMQNVAMNSGKTLHEFIIKFIKSQDPDFHAQGKLMQAMVVRLQELTLSLESLQHASILSRPFFFLKNFNDEIAQSTFKNFQPGLAFTIEGVVYILIGMAFGYFIYFLIRSAACVLLPQLKKK